MSLYFTLFNINNSFIEIKIYDYSLSVSLDNSKIYYNNIIMLVLVYSRYFNTLPILLYYVYTESSNQKTPSRQRTPHGTKDMSWTIETLNALSPGAIQGLKGPFRLQVLIFQRV